MQRDGSVAEVGFEATDEDLGDASGDEVDVVLGDVESRERERLSLESRRKASPLIASGEGKHAGKDVILRRGDTLQVGRDG